MAETPVRVIAECKVTYFIGKLLAKAGILRINNEGLLFAPTALDRAMGSIDIPIPLEDIQEFFFNETLQKTLLVKTASKTHRFIGGGLGDIHENLIALKRRSLEETTDTAAVSPETAPSAFTCFSCSKPIKTSFKFCPYCRTQLKNLCPHCRDEIEQQWISCPSCNTELKKA